VKVLPEPEIDRCHSESFLVKKLLARLTAQTIVETPLDLALEQLKDWHVTPLEIAAIPHGGYLTMEGSVRLEVECLEPAGVIIHRWRDLPFSLLVPAKECCCEAQLRVDCKPPAVNYRADGSALRLAITLHFEIQILKEACVTNSELYPRRGVEISGHRDWTQNATVTSADSLQTVLTESMADYFQMSYCVMNRHPVNSALIGLEISPDDREWLADSLELPLGPGRKNILVPEHFLRFIRLTYRSAEPGRPVVLDVWFQAQA
jgi:hypothetical protein